METLIVTTKVADDGKITIPAPGSHCGDDVEVYYQLKKLNKDEPVDKFGWPIGFWDKVYGSITDPKFERPPQGELPPVPNLDE
jgi:hypothetical protein